MKKKINTKSHFIRFFLLLLILLLITFLIHIFSISYKSENDVFNKIVISYIVNFSLGYLSYVVLIFSFKKQLSSLGFIFMYASFVKFLVLYLIFKTYYNHNQILGLESFLTVFIPYSVTLTFEVYHVTRQLKK